MEKDKFRLLGYWMKQGSRPVLDSYRGRSMWHWIAIIAIVIFTLWLESMNK